MKWMARLLTWLRPPHGQPPLGTADAIREQLHAAIDANTAAKDVNCRSYRWRVEAMAEDLFRRMDNNVSRHS